MEQCTSAHDEWKTQRCHSVCSWVCRWMLFVSLSPFPYRCIARMFCWCATEYKNRKIVEITFLFVLNTSVWMHFFLSRSVYICVCVCLFVGFGNTCQNIVNDIFLFFFSSSSAAVRRIFLSLSVYLYVLAQAMFAHAPSECKRFEFCYWQFLLIHAKRFPSACSTARCWCNLQTLRVKRALKLMLKWRKANCNQPWHFTQIAIDLFKWTNFSIALLSFLALAKELAVNLQRKWRQRSRLHKKWWFWTLCTPVSMHDALRRKHNFKSRDEGHKLRRLWPNKRTTTK